MKRELAAALIIRGGRVLLVHNRKHGQLRMEPPGGKISQNEGPEESVVREVREELGIEVRPERFFGAYMTDSPEGAFKVRMYICEVLSGEPEVLEPEKISGFGWYSLEELLMLRREGALVPNMEKALKDLGRFLKAR